MFNIKNELSLNIYTGTTYIYLIGIYIYNNIIYI